MSNYISGKGLATTNFRKKYPMLYEEDNNYIYVEGLEDRQDIWRDLVGPAVSFLTNDGFFDLDKELLPSDWASISSSLKELGDNERIKEKMVLQKMLGIEGLADKEYTGKEYIDMINQAFNTKELYEEAINQIDKYQNTNDADKEKYKNESNKDWKLGTSVKGAESKLEGIIQTTFTKVIGEFEVDLTEAAFRGHGSYQKIWEKFARAFKRELENNPRFEEFFKKYYPALASEDEATLNEIQEKLALGDKSAQAFKSSFAASVMQQFFAGRAAEKVEKAIKGGIKKGKDFSSKTRKIIFSINDEKESSNKMNSLMVGVSEILGGAVAAAITAGSSKEGITFKAIQQGLAQGNIDSSLYDAEIINLARGTINFNIPAGKEDNSVKRFVRNRLKEIEDAYSQAAGKLADNKDAIAVYESTKLYQSSSIANEKRWFSGTTYGFEAARSLIGDLGAEVSVSQNQVDLFFHRLLNEAPGGLREIVSMRNEDEDALRRIVAENVAAFLFDDYWNIGTKAAGSHGTTAIHLFRLTHIVVPLSSFLLLISKSLENAIKDTALGDTVRINLTLPQIRVVHDESIEESWAATRALAEKNFKLKINFLKNFQDSISKDFSYWS